MDNKNVALKRASQALSQLGLPALLPVLAAAGVVLKREILGGSHSVVTYPPINSLRPVDSRAVLGSIRTGNTAHLYIHIAFCETKCTFCHYAVERYRGREHGAATKQSQVSRYLEAVKTEMRLWGERLRLAGTSISSVYIGGGTPLVLEKSELEDLFVTLRDHFNLEPNAEVCVEGSPLTITAPDGAEKLQFLRDIGVSRLSFGVQSFDDAVLKYAARGYKSATAVRACRIVESVFPNWNVDLIQGLYQGSTHEVWYNLQMLERVKPPHITWYHGRFAPHRPQARWLHIPTKRNAFEDAKATLLGRMLLWQELGALGYSQVDGNRFVRDNRFADSFKKTRTSVTSDLLGIGASAYSHLSSGYPHGWFFRNTPDITQYIEWVEKGTIPIATGRLITPEEIVAASYVVGLRTARIKNANVEYVRECSPELNRHYHELEDKLICLGVLEHVTHGDGSDLRLTTLGRLFEDEVLALFYSPAVQRALA